MGLAVAWALPETLDQESRTRFELSQTWQVLTATARNRVFLALAAIFGLLAGPQLSFGVAAPFLYQDEMGLSPSAYGLIALVVGVAVLLGSFSTGMLATRMAFRRLAFADWTLYMVGAALLLGSAPWLVSIPGRSRWWYRWQSRGAARWSLRRRPQHSGRSVATSVWSADCSAP
ncbi:putative drug resistance efflux protein [Mycobacterium ulcerans str. Harvey]|uniref:Drug resistance efflux protein n=1 Tax=Mycobacterium ulcerans str. Harvey TaxID=1299332 RepID=A0ABN0QWP5_MYCUL|nr:putative drug resistance efflux protein [Mycobacterium ulcerans str. Harvey]